MKTVLVRISVSIPALVVTMGLLGACSSDPEDGGSGATATTSEDLSGSGCVAQSMLSALHGKVAVAAAIDTAVCIGELWETAYGTLLCLVPAAETVDAVYTAWDDGEALLVSCGGAAKEVKPVHPGCTMATYNTLNQHIQVSCNRFIGTGEHCSATSCGAVANRLALGKACIAAETQMMFKCVGLKGHLGDYSSMAHEVAACDARNRACGN
jgi:hypothetical protein